MNTYVAIAPDGIKWERESSRLYTHALASRTNGRPDWIINSFCGSLPRAEKRMKQLQKFYGGEWRIIEAITK